MTPWFHATPSNVLVWLVLERFWFHSARTVVHTLSQLLETIPTHYLVSRQSTGMTNEEKQARRLLWMGVSTSLLAGSFSKAYDDNTEIVVMVLPAVRPSV